MTGLVPRSSSSSRNSALSYALSPSIRLAGFTLRIRRSAIGQSCASPPVNKMARRRPLASASACIAFEVRHYRPPERPDSVNVVHPKTREDAWWPLFDAAGRPLFPELMAELDAIKESAIAGHIFRHDHKHRRGAIPLPWITGRGDLDYLRSTVKKIVRAAKLRDELSFSSFRHGGFTEGADADLTDAELRAAGRHRSARQLPTYAKRTRKQLVSVATKRRAERTKADHLSK